MDPVAAAGAPGPPPCVAADTWSPAHVVIVILENKSFNEIIGNREMPIQWPRAARL